MTEKPSYGELEQRVKDLEAEIYELRKTKDSLLEKDKRSTHAKRLARISGIVQRKGSEERTDAHLSDTHAASGSQSTIVNLSSVARPGEGGLKIDNHYR